MRIPPATTIDPDEVLAFRRLLLASSLPQGSDISADRTRCDLLTAMEELKNTLCGVQAALALDLDSSVRSQQAAAGVSVERQGRGVAAQIALARCESPNRGQQLLGLAKDLARDLPHALDALRNGSLTEFRASVVARESACLDSPDRQHLDTELFSADARAETLTWGTRQLAGRVRAITYRLDPAAAARRCAQAAADRRVTIRPAPDCMTYLTALLPVAQGVAAFASLSREVATARATGDGRGKGQLMADLLVERLTNSAGADTPRRPADPEASDGQQDSTVTRDTSHGTIPALRVDLVMSDKTLLGGTDPALLLGDGTPATPLPAFVGRALIADALDEGDKVWLRRLYTDPGGQLVAMSTTQRFARGGLADFLRIRDHGICRTPWCDAPAVEIDHIRTAGDEGPTDSENLEGYCIACNRAKQAAGWRQRAERSADARPDSARPDAAESDDIRDGDSRHAVVTVTPTGQTYRSVAPPPPRPAAA